MQPIQHCSQFAAGSSDRIICEGDAKIDAYKKAQKEKLLSLNVTYNNLKGNFSALQANHTALQANHASLTKNYTALQSTLTESQSTCSKILKALGVQETLAECQKNSETILNLFQKTFEAVKQGSHNSGLIEGYDKCVKKLISQ